VTDTATAATSASLTVLARGAWPETAGDEAPPSIAGFVLSSFSAIAAEAAERCLARRPPVDAGTVTAVVLASELGDFASAAHVASGVDHGRRIGPLLFFQSVPNSVAGHIAARRRLAGPVAALGSLESALDVAAQLIEDADADEALVVHVRQAHGPAARDRAEAVLVAAAPAEEEEP
jgi:3-oxoacyl-[acyl-carrier-protein] synthase III